MRCRTNHTTPARPISPLTTLPSLRSLTQPPTKRRHVAASTGAPKEADRSGFRESADGFDLMDQSMFDHVTFDEDAFVSALLVEGENSGVWS